jgi:hypothetical protein
LIAVESHQTHETVAVVEPSQGSVYEAMRDLDRGVVVELPIAGHDLGILQAFLESTRMVLATDDDLRSINGYSGHTPINYDAQAPILNAFPSSESLDLLARLRVDYVVLHTKPIDTGMPGVTDALNGSGFAFLDPTDAERRVAAIPSEEVTGRIDANDGIIIELAD